MITEGLVTAPAKFNDTLILILGLILGEYELLECLGAEASGKVYFIYLARRNDWHEEIGLVYRLKDNKGEYAVKLERVLSKKSSEALVPELLGNDF